MLLCHACLPRCIISHRAKSCEASDQTETSQDCEPRYTFPLYNVITSQIYDTVTESWLTHTGMPLHYGPNLLSEQLLGFPSSYPWLSTYIILSSPILYSDKSTCAHFLGNGDTNRCLGRGGLRNTKTFSLCSEGYSSTSKSLQSHALSEGSREDLSQALLSSSWFFR